MKFSPPLSPARLIRRYKRFLADVQLPDGSALTIHCPNTGSMLNCCEPGRPIWYSSSPNPKRKYPHTFELIETAPGALVGVNTGRANQLVREALENGAIAPLAGYASVQSEVRYGAENSRVDFLLSGGEGRGDEQCYMEVKNVTLGMGQGLGLFPDAVSARGTRHLRELIRIREQGHRAVLLFCVQHSGIERVAPAWRIDPQYSQTLEEAAGAGVEVIACQALLSPSEIRLAKQIPVVLSR